MIKRASIQNSCYLGSKRLSFLAHTIKAGFLQKIIVTMKISIAFIALSIAIYGVNCATQAPATTTVATTTAAAATTAAAGATTAAAAAATTTKAARRRYRIRGRIVRRRPTRRNRNRNRPNSRRRNRNNNRATRIRISNQG